jgi:hypothetical protein
MAVDLGVLLPSTEAERAIFSNCLGGGMRQLAGRVAPLKTPKNRPAIRTWVGELG